MNERIKDLVGQAKFMAEESINKRISANAELNAFAEKFAELIVKDCTSIVQSYITRWPEDTELTKLIKTHFEIKE